MKLYLKKLYLEGDGVLRKVFFFVMIFVLMLPFSVFAEDKVLYGAGQWDTIFDQNVTVTSTGVYTSVVTSGGGDIRLCVNGIDGGNRISYQFLESSKGIFGIPMVDDNTATGSSTVTEELCFGKQDVRPYVNSSGKAYVYVRAVGKKASDTVRIRIED